MNVVRPLVIAGLVIAEVGIWQWRMVIVHRGGRTSTMLLGTLGAVLQITAITQVVSDARDPLSISAYAGGVGLGVLFGLIAGDRLTPGMVGVTVVTKLPHVAHSLWDLGWPATAHDGYSEDGPVTVLFIAIGRRDEAGLHRDVHRIAPDAFLDNRRTADPESPCPALTRHGQSHGAGRSARVGRSSVARCSPRRCRSPHRDAGRPASVHQPRPVSRAPGNDSPSPRSAPPPAANARHMKVGATLGM